MAIAERPQRLVVGENGGPPSRPGAAGARKQVTFERPAVHVGHRILLYGPGGIGKTTLADLAPGPVVSIDLDDSLGVLQPPHTQRVAGVETWQDLRDVLVADGWQDVKTLVLDTATKAEEMAVAHTLRTVPVADKSRATSIESYGYGKGFQFVYETWMPLLADLDSHVQAGRNVVLICHDCTTTVPNPAGEDWIRYEPRLQSPSSGKSSIRLRTREWADHVLFLGYDIDVSKDGKARGGGTRTMYPAETPFCMAKSRRLTEPMQIIPGSADIWTTLLSIPEGRDN